MLTELYLKNGIILHVLLFTQKCFNSLLLGFNGTESGEGIGELQLNMSFAQEILF